MVEAHAHSTRWGRAPAAASAFQRSESRRLGKSTVHAYTTGQSLLDSPRVGRSGKRDLRRSGPRILHRAHRRRGQDPARPCRPLDGIAFRVPVPHGSLVDLVATLAALASVEEMNTAFVEAATRPSYRDVVSYTDRPLVPADIVGHPDSCVFSARDTMTHAHPARGREGLSQPYPDSRLAGRPQHEVP